MSCHYVKAVTHTLLGVLRNLWTAPYYLYVFGLIYLFDLMLELAISYHKKFFKFNNIVSECTKLLMIGNFAYL